MSAPQEFEIIDQYNARWRYKRSEGYRWSWGVLPGTVDADDRDMVEVWRADPTDEDSESECVAYFPRPAMVGDVCPNTCLNFSLRERGGFNSLNIALNTMHKDCRKAADAFWQYWRENGDTHKHGYYESTWGAINRAVRTVGVVPWSPPPPAPPVDRSVGAAAGQCAQSGVENSRPAGELRGG